MRSLPGHLGNCSPDARLHRTTLPRVLSGRTTATFSSSVSVPSSPFSGPLLAIDFFYSVVTAGALETALSRGCAALRSTSGGGSLPGLNLNDRSPRRRGPAARLTVYSCRRRPSAPTPRPDSRSSLLRAETGEEILRSRFFTTNTNLETIGILPWRFILER